MEIRFERVTFDEILPEMRAHYAALAGRIDSFLEEHIFGATPFRIHVDGEPAGLAAIHNESLLTLFALDPGARRYAQAIYREARRTEQVTAALVPTCDELFLAHALDDVRQLQKQACFFALGPDVPVVDTAWSLRPATAADAATIRAECGDFFDPVERRIAAGELFVTSHDGEPVGVGIMERSRIYDDVASIGMFTYERARQAGAGAATIGLLIGVCRGLGIAPVAGCWYYNHRSKRTLERAGLHSPTRLLRIEY
jgi:hypothetical protein